MMCDDCDIRRALNRTNERFNFRGEVGHKDYPTNVMDWSYLTNNKPGITYERNKFKAMIHYRHPITGNDTTKTALRSSFIEAVIARNEIAATLLRSGLISFDKFTKYTS